MSKKQKHKNSKWMHADPNRAATAGEESWDKQIFNQQKKVLYCFTELCFREILSGMILANFELFIVEIQLI